MSRANIKLVSASEASEPVEAAKVETIGDRARRIQAEAQALTREHVAALSAALNVVERTASEIAQGGEIYPAGVRDFARRLAEETVARAQSLEALIGKTM